MLTVRARSIVRAMPDTLTLTIGIAVVVIVLGTFIGLGIYIYISSRKDANRAVEPPPDGFAWVYFDHLRFARCLECEALVQKDTAPAHLEWHERHPALTHDPVTR